MIKSYQLNRLKITGPLNDNTPLCVILEIADYIGNFKLQSKNFRDESYINQIITYINTTTYNTVTEKNNDYDNKDLQLIGRFINPNIKNWKFNPLMESFKHLLEFYDENIPPIPDGEINIGKKSMSSPFAYNICMIYKLCIFYGIKTNRKMKHIEMAQAIKYYIQDITELKEGLIKTIKYSSRIDIVNLIVSNSLNISIPTNIQNISSQHKIITKSNIKQKLLDPINYQNIDINNLNKIHSTFIDFKKVILRIIPENHEEAIILTAIIYGINLTDCKNPYEEYLKMKDNTMNSSAENIYIPNDKEFRDKYLKNPDFYNIRIMWEPKLAKIYSTEDVKNLAKLEGYEDELNLNQDGDERKCAENLLHLSRCSNTFYLGIHPNLDNAKTKVDFDSSDEINKKILLSYGIVEEKNFALYKVTELTACFKDSMSFSNPENRNEQFSLNSINKLKKIALTHSLNDKTEISTAYKELLKTMDDIKEFNKKHSEQARKLYNLYINGDENKKQLIIQLITQILEMGYYMRGWKVESDEIPVINKGHLSISSHPAEYQLKVVTNSDKAMNTFVTNVENSSEDIKTIFEKLPLMFPQVRSRDIVFEISNSQIEGFTIMDRINIIKTDDQTNELESPGCIRLASNRFMSSGYYYLTKICKLPEPFDIKRMEKMG